MPYRIVCRLPHLPFAAFAFIVVLAIAATPAVRRSKTTCLPMCAGGSRTLRKKAADLLSQKDKNGVSTKRGTYSKNFRKVDDSTYAATFHVDTVEPSSDDPKNRPPANGALRTDAEGIRGYALEDREGRSQGNLRQPVPRMVRRRRDLQFDKLAFEREGMKISATNGYLWMVSRQGKPQGLTLYADDLAYAYSPPPDTGYYGLIKSRIVKEHSDDLIFARASRNQLRRHLVRDAAPAIFTGLAKIEGVTRVAPRRAPRVTSETRLTAN
jgi:hypothetical protein